MQPPGQLSLHLITVRRGNEQLIRPEIPVIRSADRNPQRAEHRGVELLARGQITLEWDGSYPEPQWSDTATLASRYTTKQAGWYGALRFSLADPLKLIVGGRYSTWKTDSVGFGGGSRQAFDKDAFVPYAGLLYDINENYTAYVSYTGIFNPQSYQDRNGSWLDNRNTNAAVGYLISAVEEVSPFL